MALDDSIGRVMDELERRRLLDDTLIVYMGDNGFLWGEHGLLDKRAMYEPSIRIPMLAHCPSLFPGGRRLSGMALNIDVAPTLLEMAGVAAPEGLHGRSLLPNLTGGGAPRTEFLYEYFWERSFPQTPGVMGIRTERHSYMHYHGIWDDGELYDIRDDPEQRTNLLAGSRPSTECNMQYRIPDPARRGLVTSLQERMAKLLADTGGRLDPSWG
jgi:N-acetylglucosamine-6-sulfatase